MLLKKLLLGLVILLLYGCDSYIGCGTVYNKTVELNGDRFEYYAYMRTEEGKTYKVYINYFDWEKLKEGDIICAE